MKNKLRIFSSTSETELSGFIFSSLPKGNFKRIVIKPNWVIHQTEDKFPVEALVTSTELIRITIEACLKKYKESESITVCDIPLQSCRWDLLFKQANIDKLEKLFSKIKNPIIRFLDLRNEKWISKDGFLVKDTDVGGDPIGYVEIDLTEKSFLDEISSNSSNFRVSDYDPGEIKSVHMQGDHKYLISKTILDCDLFINMPKMKTHQKAGITGALKNLVGINGSKSFLVHHQKGTKKQGGDEFPDDISKLILFQVRIREILQKKSGLLFQASRRIWSVIKKISGIKTTGTIENINSGKFYTGSGSWYGNDSIWRMVYDLNLIILFADKNGILLFGNPVREYISIMDGIISGEGNGPLQPIPVESGMVLISDNPFIMDISVSILMGFDYKKIPSLSNYHRFPYSTWSSFTPENYVVEKNGAVLNDGIDSIKLIKNYLPPPGWKNHIEITG